MFVKPTVWRDEQTVSLIFKRTPNPLSNQQIKPICTGFIANRTEFMLINGTNLQTIAANDRGLALLGCTVLNHR
jgi:hypothetical protein